jgi:hypothetical protein
MLFGLVLACNGDDKRKAANADTGTPLGQGVVEKVEGRVEDAKDLPEGKGTLLLDVFHTDRAVNQKVKITVSPEASPDTVAAKGEGNQEFQLDPGLYRATIAYDESDLARGFEGAVTGLKVNLGWLTRYHLGLNAPVGQIRLRFHRTVDPTQPPTSVNDKVELAVWKDGDEPDIVPPIWKGAAGDFISLPAGTYDAKATYAEPGELPTVEWFHDLVVAGGMAKTEREVDLQVDTSGVRIDAFNYSRDVNGRTTIYFFNPGANVNQAVAKATGKAGEVIKVDPGKYDVLVVYQPSDDSPELRGEKVLKEFEVPERGGVRRQIDLEKALAVARIKVADGDVDVSERTDLRIMRSGADPDAASSILDQVGVGEHWIPVGTYDLYLTYRPVDGDPKRHGFPKVELGNGFVWAQTFSAKEPEWSAADVRRPPEPLQPISALQVETGGDDDSAAPAPTPAAAGGSAPAPEAPKQGG